MGGARGRRAGGPGVPLPRAGANRVRLEPHRLRRAAPARACRAAGRRPAGRRRLGPGPRG
ncbi:hypothetical protein FJ693_04230 [Georgenia yuyongxinii]|uniref:Uncharacterized protein n=1 Tax=Georgenia yuyongxinii TaxID=2589797 RepID=A0A552WVG7_9MICO|nr:hypothetical protein FJ693_04230 [Georgenia yuyongxinii]